MKKKISILLVFLLLCATCVFSVTAAALADNGTDGEYRLKMVDETSDKIVFTGTWGSVANKNYIGGYLYSTKTNGATATYTFNSPKIFLMGGASKADSVSVAVSIDGNKADDILIGSTASELLFESENLGDGEHTVVLTVSSPNGNNFRFDGFYQYAEIIGLGEVEVNCKDDAISYAYMAESSGYLYVDDKTGGQLTYTFEAANVDSIEIYAEKNADSAKIEVFLDGVSLATVDLLGNGQKNVCVYTVTRAQLNPLSFDKKKLTIKVVYVDGSRYFVFHGLKVKKYFDEDDWDKNDLKLDTSDIDGSLIKVSKNGNSKNVTVKGMSVNPSGVISSTTYSDSLEWLFKGSAFEIVADKSPSGGKFDISIDDVKQGKVNLYAQEAREGVVVFRAPELEGYLGEEYVHKITIKVLEEKSYYSAGNSVVIRRLDLYKRLDTDEENVDYNQFDLKVDEQYNLPETLERKDLNTKYVSDGFGQDGSTYYTNTSGSTLSFTFRGQGLEIYGEKGPDKGKADVYIDGNLIGRVNTFALSPVKNVLLLRVTELSQSNHACTLQVSSAKDPSSSNRYVSVMGVKVLSLIGDVDKSRIIDDSSFYVRSEGFGIDKKSGYYGGTALFSNSMASDTMISLSFRGTSLKIYGTKNTDAGIATVTIDGKEYTYNARNGSQFLSTMVFESPALDGDVNHTLTIRIESKNNPVGARAYITVDYFDIENYEDIVFEGYLEIDDAHKDCGTDPALDWRYTENKDIGIKAESAPKASCRSNIGTSGGKSAFVIIGIAIIATVAAAMFRRRNTSNN